MDLTNVMNEVGTRLDTIDGLRVFAYLPGTAVPPFAVVDYPDQFTFDETYGRGMDQMTLPVLVGIGRPTDRTTRNLLLAYCNGSGAKSIKAVLESGTYTALDTIRVVDIEFHGIRLADVEYMAATFNVNITGSGS
jgi:hypothetical protein